MGFLIGLLSGMGIGLMVSIIVSSAGEREIWEEAESEEEIGPDKKS